MAPLNCKVSNQPLSKIEMLLCRDYMLLMAAIFSLMATFL